MKLDSEKRKLIGKRILGALAKADKMMMKELSAKMGVPDNTVSYWCKGERTPNVAQIMQIAEITGVSTDYLLGLSKIPTNDPDVQMIGEYTGLTEETIEKLHRADFLPYTPMYYSDYHYVDILNISEEEKAAITSCHR